MTEAGATAIEKLLWVTSLASREAWSHYQQSLPLIGRGGQAQDKEKAEEWGTAGVSHVRDFLASGTGSGSSKCLLPPEKGLSDGRGLGWRLLTSVGNWHVRVRSSQPRTSLPAQPSYNHPPLLVTEAAMPHCTL